VAAELGFPAMGTDVQVVVVGGRPGLVDMAGPFIDDLERLWSRFLPDSEVSRMNAGAGSVVPVSPETLALVERALRGARVTGGRYDPTVLGALLRAGYDRTFVSLADGRPTSRSMLTSGWERIVVDRRASSVTLPTGVGFDGGGIGKGYAADLLVDALIAAGAAGACVSVGGDLRAEGEPPGPEPWTITIEHPARVEPAALVGLRSGAVATSTRTRRTWGAPEDRRHHLIDPTTGQPARTGVLSATAIAAEAWQAEVLAKAAFLGGVARGLDLLVAAGADGLIVDDDGEVCGTPGLGAFTGRTTHRRGAGDRDVLPAPSEAEAV
jgi:thiamine biosynthesis lipoprotein